MLKVMQEESAKSRQASGEDLKELKLRRLPGYKAKG